MPDVGSADAVVLLIAAVKPDGLFGKSMCLQLCL